MLKHKIKITVYACLCLLLAHAINAQVWSVQNRRVMKDGQPFIVQGVNYAPIPAGAGPMEGTQWGDLFHSQWAHLHDRDLPLLRAAGVNSIRVYNLQLTDPVSNQPLDHTSFFDKLYNNGDKPIFIFITYALDAQFGYLGPYDQRPNTQEFTFQTVDGKWYALDPDTEVNDRQGRDDEKNYMIEIAKKYGNHPAVMGFVIGNEQNDAITRSNCMYWAWLEEIDAAVKQQAPNALTATTIVDDAMITMREATKCNALPHLDAWGINSYRGTATTGFDVLFTEFAAITNKALLITEFGCPSSTRVENKFVMMPDNSRLQADYLEAHWNDIMANNAICSGGFVFSWIDEWWKHNTPNEQTPNDVAQNFAFPGQWADEEAWGLLAAIVDCDQISNWATRTDQVWPRAAYYVMGKLFGAWVTLPANAYESPSYPMCNGWWVGTAPPGTPIPEPIAPTAAPVSAPETATPITTEVPVGSPNVIITPSVITVPVVVREDVSSATNAYYNLSGLVVVLVYILL